MLPRIGIMRALHRNVVWEFKTDRKDMHGGAANWRAIGNKKPAGREPASSPSHRPDAPDGEAP
jgi:hypothetical protein